MKTTSASSNSLFSKKITAAILWTENFQLLLEPLNVGFNHLMCYLNSSIFQNYGLQIESILAS